MDGIADLVDRGAGKACQAYVAHLVVEHKVGIDRIDRHLVADNLEFDGF